MPDFHNFTPDGAGWETRASEVPFRNPHLEVRAVKVATPGRPEERDWTVVHRKGAVVIVPITMEGSVLLVRQERIPVRRALWELPAGQIDEAEEHGESLIQATARRELCEETGHELAPGGALQSLGYFFSSPGFTDEHCYLFLARPVLPSALGPKYDDGEVITECRAFSMEEWRQMIAESEICDANTLAAFARLSALKIVP